MQSLALASSHETGSQSASGGVVLRRSRPRSPGGLRPGPRRDRPSRMPDALRVTATTTVFADIVQNVGGDSGRPSSRSSRPASGRRTTSRSRTTRGSLADADLHRLERRRARRLPRQLIDAAGGGHAPRLVLGDGIPTIDGRRRGRTRTSGSTRPSSATTTCRRSSAQLSAARPGRSRHLSRRTPRPTPRSSTALDAALDGQGRDDPGREPQARHVPRRVPVLRPALRLRARRGRSSPNVGQEPTRVRPGRARREGQGGAASRRSSPRRSSVPKLAQTLADEAGITQVVTTLYNDAVGPAPADTYPGDDALEHGPDRAALESPP